MLVSTDLSSTLKSFSKINTKVELLSEINRDILVGKRNTNCISCAKGLEEKYEPVKHVTGKDGKLYMS